MHKQIIGRPSAYRKSLQNNPYWEKVKRAVRLRENYTCQNCRQKGLHDTHHTAYTVNGKSIVGKELDHLYLMQYLCQNCHKAAHNKN